MHPFFTSDFTQNACISLNIFCLLKTYFLFTDNTYSIRKKHTFLFQNLKQGEGMRSARMHQKISFSLDFLCSGAYFILSI